MDWFLYDRDLRHESVKQFSELDHLARSNSKKSVEGNFRNITGGRKSAKYSANFYCFINFLGNFLKVSRFQFFKNPEKL